MIDVIVVGGGVAGMNAALYAKRNGKSVLILEQETFGGQITNSPKVENLPSIKSISGMEFSDKLLEQITDIGVEIELEKVESIEKICEGHFKVKTEYAERECRAVVLAVGVKHRTTGVKDEEKFLGKGVYYCALCDGPFYAGQEVSLIGDANTALQYTLLLSNICKKVHVYALFDKLFADQVLINAVKSRENVDIKMQVALQEFKGEDKLEGLKFKETNTGKEFEVSTPAVFIAIGQIPDNEKYKNLVDLDDNGYFAVDESCMTKTSGVFVAGDCRRKKIRQLATAISDGAVAGTNASLYIDSLA